jgi:hypothetical protein
MKSYRVELIQKCTYFADIEARDEKEAVSLMINWPGQAERPYPPEIVQVTATLIQDE